MRSFIFFVVFFTLLAAVLGAPVVHQHRRRRRRANVTSTTGDTITVGDTDFTVTATSNPTFTAEDVLDGSTLTNNGGSTVTSTFTSEIGRVAP